MTRVRGIPPVVSQHEVLPVQNPRRAPVIRRTVRGEHIGFIQRPAIDGDALIGDLDLLAWQPDNALEESLGRIARLFEYDEVATLQPDIELLKIDRAAQRKVRK
jgi:hypothetical protein